MRDRECHHSTDGREDGTQRECGFAAEIVCGVADWVSGEVVVEGTGLTQVILEIPSSQSVTPTVGVPSQSRLITHNPNSYSTHQFLN